PICHPPAGGFGEQLPPRPPLPLAVGVRRNHLLDEFRMALVEHSAGERRRRAHRNQRGEFHATTSMRSPLLCSTSPHSPGRGDPTLDGRIRTRLADLICAVRPLE